MKMATAVALVWLAGILVVCGGQEPQGGGASATPSASASNNKPGDGSPIPQDTRVVIKVTRDRTATGEYVDKIVVRPQFAIIRKQRPLSFSVEDLQPGQHVEIDFEIYQAKKGPFPPTGDAFRGRYILNERTKDVGTANSDTAGYFKYHVVLRQGTKDLFALDPGVIVKNEI